MKLSCALRFSLLACLAAAGVRAEVEFAGYIKTASELKFVLTDPMAKRTSDWLAVGSSFSGYKIVGYEAPVETLLVEKDGMTTRLRLKGAGAEPWWKKPWVSSDADRLTRGQRLIVQFEEAVGHRIRPEGGWWPYYSEELDKAKGRKRSARDSVAAGQPGSERELEACAELLRHMLGRLQETQRMLGTDARAQAAADDFRLMIERTEKELAN